MEWWKRLDRQIADELPDLCMLQDEPMCRHTSFRIGGAAKRMAFPTSGEQAVLLMHFARECGARPLVIGRGTNLLAPDEGLDRLVINTTQGLKRLKASSETEIMAEAGVPLSRLAELAAKQGLTGLEFAHGIPGTVGGAICMNAGAYGGEMKQVVQCAAVLFPEEGVKYLSNEELGFSYRNSLLSEQREAVVLYAVFRLRQGEKTAIRETMRELMRRRKDSQPLEFPSAGSTFKRPAGNFAGTLIDRCGLKGLMVGGAQVSTKHAGFVINRKEATCADVRELIRQIQERVFSETGVYLEPEVKIIT